MKYQKHDRRELLLWSRKALLLHILFRWALSTNLQTAPSIKYLCVVSFLRVLEIIFCMLLNKMPSVIKLYLIVCWEVNQIVLGVALWCPYLYLWDHKYRF